MREGSCCSPPPPPLPPPSDPHNQLHMGLEFTGLFCAFNLRLTTIVLMQVLGLDFCIVILGFVLISSLYNTTNFKGKTGFC